MWAQPGLINDIGVVWQTLKTAQCQTCIPFEWNIQSHGSNAIYSIPVPIPVHFVEIDNLMLNEHFVHISMVASWRKTPFCNFFHSKSPPVNFFLTGIVFISTGWLLCLPVNFFSPGIVFISTGWLLCLPVNFLCLPVNFFTFFLYRSTFFSTGWLNITR